MNEDDLLIGELEWLRGVLIERMEHTERVFALPRRTVAREMGRAMMIEACTLIGNLYGLPAETAIGIGQDALKEFDRLKNSRN